VKASELRAMDDAALREELQNAYEELFNLRFQKVTGRMANTMRPRQVKKDIARIKTILRERELEQANLG
jgi:large subunit ribosomal protein L29